VGASGATIIESPPADEEATGNVTGGMMVEVMLGQWSRVLVTM
jgi:hypothetical protein